MLIVLVYIWRRLERGCLLHMPGASLLSGGLSFSILEVGLMEIVDAGMFAFEKLSIICKHSYAWYAEQMPWEHMHTLWPI